MIYEASTSIQILTYFGWTVSNVNAVLSLPGEIEALVVLLTSNGLKNIKVGSNGFKKSQNYSKWTEKFKTDQGQLKKLQGGIVSLSGMCDLILRLLMLFFYVHLWLLNIQNFNEKKILILMKIKTKHFQIQKIFS